jgi:aspartate kinase
MIKIFKFGGASVKDASAVRNLAEIVSDYTDYKLVVVISAMGKTTNAFENLLHSITENPSDSALILSEIRSYHFGIVNELFEDPEHQVQNEIETLFNEVINLIRYNGTESYDKKYDQLVSYGELLSTTIVCGYLNSIGMKAGLLDARNVVKTDQTYRDAVIDWETTQNLIQKTAHKLFSQTDIIITQGFIGSDQTGNTVTLGREGSDYTAAIFGYSLNASDVTIWKDVPGLLNADPKFYPEAVKLDMISYPEAIELAYYGATVIHPKTIKPLENKQIPLFVKSFLQPHGSGSVIGKSNGTVPYIPSYIFKTRQVLISILPRDFSFIAEKNLQSIFGVFSQYNLSVNLMQNSAISFSVCVDYKPGKTQEVIAELQKTYKVRYNENLWLITIRHYDQETIDRILAGKRVLLEQRSRSTVQFVVETN